MLTFRQSAKAVDHEAELQSAVHDEAFEQPLRRHQPDSRGDQLDRQRQAVQALAQLGRDGQALRVEREGRIRQTGPMREEFDGWRQCLCVVVMRGRIERMKLEHAFAVER